MVYCFYWFPMADVSCTFAWIWSGGGVGWGGGGEIKDIMDLWINFCILYPTIKMDSLHFVRRYCRKTSNFSN